MPGPRRLRSDAATLPINDSAVTLILIPFVGEILFGCSPTEKLGIKERFNAAVGDRLVAVWPGKFSSHAFDIPPEKLLELQ